MPLERATNLQNERGRLLSVIAVILSKTYQSFHILVANSKVKNVGVFLNPFWFGWLRNSDIIFLETPANEKLWNCFLVPATIFKKSTSTCLSFLLQRNSGILVGNLFPFGKVLCSISGKAIVVSNPLTYQPFPLRLDHHSSGHEILDSNPLRQFLSHYSGSRYLPSANRDWAQFDWQLE